MTPLKELHKIKADFFRRFPDPGYFDCGDFNAIKIILDGIKVDYISKGINKCRFFYPEFILETKRKIKKITSSIRPADQTDMLGDMNARKFVLVDSSGRTTRNEKGEAVSLYFESIKQKLGHNNIVHIVENRRSDPHPYDINSSVYLDIVNTMCPDEDDKALKHNLFSLFKKLQKEPLITPYELLNIQIAMQKFYNEYRQWKLILSKITLEKIYIICHYHKEGAILAMRRAKRKIIELQHGLISQNDLFYCFPENIAPYRSKALFPDKLLVYGNFWKKKLRKAFEFRPEDIEVVGCYYLDWLAKSEVKPKTKNHINILVCTQTFLHEVFITYVKTLHEYCEKSLPDSTILLKIHPSEDPLLYNELKHLRRLQFTNDPITELVKKADCQISVYSTTLYEGAAEGVPGFSLNIPELVNYIDEIEVDGISKKVPLDFNPFTSKDLGNRIPHSQIFEPFNQQVFLNA